MKLVSAVIRPFKLEEVKEALSRLGVADMTVMEAKSFGPKTDHTETYRGSQYTVDFQPRLRVEVAVSDEKKDEIVAAMVQAARTGKPGDGQIFVSDLGEIVRIRTGESRSPSV